MPQASPILPQTPRLPSWSLRDLQRELLLLTRSSDREMVRHLLSGLEADLPSLTPREVLHELLTILIGVSQTLDLAAEPARLSSSQGAPPMT